MKFKVTGDFNLDPDKILKEAMLNDLFKKVPAARPYKTQIKFEKKPGKTVMNFEALPIEIVQQINEKYQK